MSNHQGFGASSPEPVCNVEIRKYSDIPKDSSAAGREARKVREGDVSFEPFAWNVANACQKLIPLLKKNGMVRSRH